MIIKNPITDKQLLALKPKPGQNNSDYAVGGVPYLYIRCFKSGAKSWRFRIKRGAKFYVWGLGSYPNLSLSDAREKVRELLKLQSQGVDLVKQRYKAKAEQISLFSEVAYQYHKAKIIPELTNQKHIKNWISQIEKYIFPIIGDLNIKDIETNHIIKALEPIWTEKHETAKRIRQRLEVIFDYAIASNLVERGFNPAEWKGNLEQLLPKINKQKKQDKHLPALKPELINQFLKDLRDYQGISARALEFIILTACRSGEARLATWSEIDFKNKVWTIPADRMKAGKSHTVPLSEQALNLLAGLPRLSEYLFTAPRGGALSDMAVNNVIRKLDKKGKTYTDETTGRLIVPHGFRSTFKDWCRQPQRYGHVNYSDELSELALAHVNSDSTRSAYARNELLEERRPLMSDWAKYCEGIKSVGKVVEMRRA
ncbi:MAG: tyrosine-type recombinase/integrase [Desulforegulaceae bacterium]|nr:tyrosine-type recombinase/integrase [Desulforegulaceae bacterium]